MYDNSPITNLLDNYYKKNNFLSITTTFSRNISESEKYVHKILDLGNGDIKKPNNKLNALNFCVICSVTLEEDNLLKEYRIALLLYQKSSCLEKH